MKLYSAWYCPFAQRAWWASLHKEIDFELVEVDPYDKNEQWLETSRGVGQVPVASYSDEAVKNLVGSNRIVEFLDDEFPDSEIKLLPKNHRNKAQALFWMDYVDRAIMPYLYRLLQCEDLGETRQDLEDKLLAGLSEFTEAMDELGPFFYGIELSAVDIALGPFAYRIDVLLNHYRQFSLPTEGKLWSRYQIWLDAIKAVPSFQATSIQNKNYDQRLIDFYEVYARGEGQTNL